MEPQLGLDTKRVKVLLILDVGCGNAKKGTIGIDIDREVRPDIVADAIALPFKGETFDKVISVQCLEHLWKHPSRPMETVMSALKEFNRVLKEGGSLDLTVPNFAGISTLLKWMILRGEGMNSANGPEGYFLLGSHLNAYQVHHVAFTQRNLRHALEQAGFVDIIFLPTMINSGLLERVKVLIPKSRHDLIRVVATRRA
jgi:SAM-dependent methyltransferase